VTRARIATAWLGGCSGCHMSFLDMDEWLFELAEVADIVYSPIADIKEFPDDVDVTFVEGALANEDNLELALEIRAKSRLVVSFGDCAVTGNVPAMRNVLGLDNDVNVLERAYLECADEQRMVPKEDGIVPSLLKRVMPLHEAVHVDFHLPGCPPPAARIKSLLVQVIEGKTPILEGADIKFG
jgi:NAD-reducing hydrogenase small subunit